MRIENNGYNISINFIGRAKDGLNVWNELKTDANSIEIFLGFSVEDGWGTIEGMCIPLVNLTEIYNGLSRVLNNEPFYYSCNFPFENSNEDDSQLQRPRGRCRFHCARGKKNVSEAFARCLSRKGRWAMEAIHRCRGDRRC